MCGDLFTHASSVHFCVVRIYTNMHLFVVRIFMLIPSASWREHEEEAVREDYNLRSLRYSDLTNHQHSKAFVLYVF